MKKPMNVTTARLMLASLTVLSLLSGRTQAEVPLNKLTESESRSGWELLFDGKSFDGWRNYKKEGVSDGWKVVDGAMVREGKGAGDIITDKKYKAFELLLEYNISPAGNSGVMFHVTEENDRPWQSGPEIQVQDNVEGHDPQKAGWLYQLYKPQPPSWAADQSEKIDATRPAGQWNQLYVRIAGDNCEVVMNGVRYYTFKLGSADWDKRVAASKFAAYDTFGNAGSGHICLQDHNDLVSYRNVKIRELGEDGSVPQPIDGKLELTSKLAFPELKWEDWQAVDEAGNLRPMRIVELADAGDGSGRLFAVSQQGGIWIFENREDVKEAKLFYDLRGKVKDWKSRGANEEGLLGLAPHPDFKNNGHVYIYYTHPTEKKSVISRITVSEDEPNRAAADSETVIMEIDQPFQNHNGGSMEFGPDGYLYIGLGDGGYRNDPHAAGQDLSKILGKILRIDVDKADGDRKYGIPADNPFVEHKGALGEIYAYGLRNPWRIAFDSKTGDLWCGDVGQELWEEVDLITKGGNYGWSMREGSYPFGNTAVESPNPPIGPVWEYDHRIGRSITGGRVYRSDRLPELEGKYLYADYVTGCVWALDYDQEAGRVRKNLQIFGGDVPVLAFGEDANGEVYYLTQSARGECIYRFESAEK
ncbi:Soluble aldose sugar dehydrogenase YliI precursor [Rosistilla oblonga]|nr:Soluble aldose sugar dehydrogenase YliI precursor [Rosistilla oblonga]